MEAGRFFTGLVDADSADAVLMGEADRDTAGWSVGGADIDGDGFADVHASAEPAGAEGWLTVSSVEKSFNKRPVVRGVSLALERGEAVGHLLFAVPAGEERADIGPDPLELPERLLAVQVRHGQIQYHEIDLGGALPGVEAPDRLVRVLEGGVVGVDLGADQAVGTRGVALGEQQPAQADARREEPGGELQRTAVAGDGGILSRVAGVDRSLFGGFGGALRVFNRRVRFRTFPGIGGRLIIGQILNQGLQHFSGHADHVLRGVFADDGLAGIQQLAGDATLLFYMTEEAQEGRDAYKEKRRPEFERFPKRP